jgi:hypothetical protein
VPCSGRCRSWPNLGTMRCSMPAAQHSASQHSTSSCTAQHSTVQPAAQHSTGTAAAQHGAVRCTASTRRVQRFAATVAGMCWPALPDSTSQHTEPCLPAARPTRPAAPSADRHVAVFCKPSTHIPSDAQPCVVCCTDAAAVDHRRGCNARLEPGHDSVALWPDTPPSRTSDCRRGVVFSETGPRMRSMDSVHTHPDCSHALRCPSPLSPQPVR